MKPLIILLFLLFPISLVADDKPTKESPSTIFDDIKQLAGEWKSTSQDSKTTVVYELIASESAVVEKWIMSPGRSSMTIYSMDGEALIATHYCPQGNAPTLKYSDTSKTKEHRFIFEGGSNLQDKSGYHEHEFSIVIESNSRIRRSETYIQNGGSYTPADTDYVYEIFERVIKG